MICLMRERVDEHRAVIGELAFHPVRARLARKLAQLAGVDARQTVGLTQDELARMVNTTRQRVSAELSRFRERCLIAYESSGKERRIRVLDLEGLSSIGSARGV